MALSALVFIWALGYLVFVRTPAAPPLDEIATITRSADFRAGSREIGIDPCLALPHQDPELIVIGSSYVYTDISAQTLEETARLRTGYCGIPAWKTDTLLPFIEYLEFHELLPQRIIWMVDPSMLKINDSSDQDRLEDTKRLLADRKMAVDRAVRWLSRAEKGLPPLLIDFEGLQTSLRQQGDALDGLDPVRIDRLVRANDRQILFRPYRALGRLNTNPRNEQNLSEFCKFIQEGGLSLDVVGAPFPDRTAEISSISWTDFSQHLRDIIPCADRVIVLDLKGWSLDMRHFINRKMFDDYDYDVWRMDDLAFESYVETLDRRGMQKLFDSDHLNGVGAEIFTREIFDALDIK